MAKKEVNQEIEQVRQSLSSFLHLEIPAELPLKIHIKKKGKEVVIEGVVLSVDMESSSSKWKEQLEREIESNWILLREPLSEKIVDYLNDQWEEECNDYVREHFLELQKPEEMVERLNARFVDCGDMPFHWEMEEEYLYEQPSIGLQLAFNEFEDGVSHVYVLEELPQTFEDCRPLLDELITQMQESLEEEEEDYARLSEEEEEEEEI